MLVTMGTTQPPRRMTCLRASTSLLVGLKGKAVGLGTTAVGLVKDKAVGLLKVWAVGSVKAKAVGLVKAEVVGPVKAAAVGQTRQCGRLQAPGLLGSGQAWCPLPTTQASRAVASARGLLGRTTPNTLWPVWQVCGNVGCLACLTSAEPWGPQHKMGACI